MEWILASLAAVTAALICAVLLLAERQRGMAARHCDLVQRLIELESIVGELRQQIALLAADASAAHTTGFRQQAHDPLVLIEKLSDVTALQDDQSLVNIAHEVALPAGVASDLFEADRKLLAISRLLNQGNSLPEIAARLNRPLGEIELLANTRPHNRNR